MKDLKLLMLNVLLLLYSTILGSISTLTHAPETGSRNRCYRPKFDASPKAVSVIQLYPMKCKMILSGTLAVGA